MSSDDRPILLVEDDQNDVFFLQYAFETAGIKNPLHVVLDGQQAIHYLSGTGEFSDRRKFPIPAVVLLDLKLPVKMGLEVMRWIQSQPQLKHLLVIVLTSSADIGDVERAYALGARSYLVKPVSLEKRIEMVRVIKDYWLDLNCFPTPSSPDKPKVG
ncbi:MAG TPA: response regulator [Verrucomicrobiae bacterium]|nr:response regulator [Verrucomicrobiae bacterium]